MKMPARSVTVLGIMALCVGVWISSPVTAEELGIDFWNLSDLEEQLARGERRHWEMDRTDQLIMNRITLRQDIIKNLIAEKITLEEAGRGFLSLNQTEPCALRYLQLIHPNGTDLDRAVMQVVSQLQNHHLPGNRECHLRCLCETMFVRGHMFP